MIEKLEKVKKVLDEIFKDELEHLDEIHEEFVDFFGEEYVDFYKVDTYVLAQCVLGLTNSKIINRIKNEQERDRICRQIYHNYVYNNSIEELDIILSYKDIIRRIFTTCEYFEPSLIANSHLTIYYPKVTITNELDEKYDITDVYIRVYINYFDKLQTIKLLRSTLTKIEFESGYYHSHASLSQPTISTAKRFHNLCFGKGPIVNTIDNLKGHYDKDIYGLLCQEIDNYVRIESIEGIPYKAFHDLNSKKYRAIKNNNYKFDLSVHYGVNNVGYYDLRHFIRYVLKSNKLNFIPSANAIQIAMSFIDYHKTISELLNEFIKITNDKYNLKTILVEGYYEGSSFYEYDKTCLNKSDLKSLIGAPCLCFKGKKIALNIIDDDSMKDNKYINSIIAKSILYTLLNAINYAAKRFRIK